MSKIFFATKNPGKVDYLRRVVQEFDGVKVVQYPLNLPEMQFTSVEDVANHKVMYAFNEINNGRANKVPCIALDSGLYIPALRNWPGTLVKSALDGLGVEGILKLMEGKPRACEIRPCLAYWDGNLTDPLTFSAKIFGNLAEQLRGETKDYHWSDLARVFIPYGLSKTEAEMSREEYDSWRRKVDISAPGFAKWLTESSD